MMLKIRNGGAWVLYDGIARASFGAGGEGRIRRHREKGTWEIRGGLAVGASEEDGAYGEWEPDVVYLDPHRAEAKVVATGKPPAKAIEFRGGEPVEVDRDPKYEYPAWCNCIVSGEERFFAFSEAYLLNDAGKTVERIA